MVLNHILVLNVLRRVSSGGRVKRKVEESQMVKVMDCKNEENQVTRKTDDSNSVCYAAISALQLDDSMLFRFSLSLDNTKT
jgi:hypothetical protein